MRVIIGAILMAVYNIGVIGFSIIFEIISMIFGGVALAFAAVHNGLEFVCGGFVRLERKKAYSEYVEKEEIKKAELAAEQAARLEKDSTEVEIEGSEV